VTKRHAESANRRTVDLEVEACGRTVVAQSMSVVTSIDAWFTEDPKIEKGQRPRLSVRGKNYIHAQERCGSISTKNKPLPALLGQQPRRRIFSSGTESCNTVPALVMAHHNAIALSQSFLGSCVCSILGRSNRGYRDRADNWSTHRAVTLSQHSDAFRLQKSLVAHR
jgi:hypothetical protein